MVRPSESSTTKVSRVTLTFSPATPSADQSSRQ
jgi:hypothetical protein